MKSVSIGSSCTQIRIACQDKLRPRIPKVLGSKGARPGQTVEQSQSFGKRDAFVRATSQQSKRTSVFYTYIYICLVNVPDFAPFRAFLFDSTRCWDPCYGNMGSKITGRVFWCWRKGSDKKMHTRTSIGVLARRVITETRHCESGHANL